MDKNNNYSDQLLKKLSQIIEEVGQDDEEYNNKQKALDIFSVLENLLAYTIYTTCNTAEEVRDSSEESYMNIKRQALSMIRNNPPEE